MIRHPVVAGTFYPLDKETLVRQLDSFFKETKGNGKPISAIVPHAGYMYSGKVAAHTYSSLPQADTYILLGPNHNCMGPNISVFPEGGWSTPLGTVQIDSALTMDICKNSRAELDTFAHEREHSIEVQLPFLQHRFKDFKIVPISLMPSPYAGDKEEFYLLCSELAEAIASTIKKSNKKIIILASSDFSHYVSQEVAKRDDSKAIELINSLSAKEFLSFVIDNNLTICGYGPICTAILASKKLGAKKGKLLKYSTSGDTTGDYSQVVGYASILIE